MAGETLGKPELSTEEQDRAGSDGHTLGLWAQGASDPDTTNGAVEALARIALGLCDVLQGREPAHLRAPATQSSPEAQEAAHRTPLSDVASKESRLL